MELHVAVAWFIFFTLASVHDTVTQTLSLEPAKSLTPLLAHSINFGMLQHQGFWRKFNVESAYLQVLTKALSPTVLRFGGSETEFTTFVPSTATNYMRKNFTALNFTGRDLDQLLYFCRTNDLHLLLDINVNKRDSYDNWDPSNFEILLQYLKEKMHYDLSFQLGNEPNSFENVIHRRISAQQLANDYRRLRNVLDANGFASSALYGPEVTKPKLLSDSTTKYSTRGDQYLNDFILNQGAEVVDFVTWHQYYIDKKYAKLEDFTNADVLNYFPEELDIIKKVVKKHNVSKPVCLTETGSAWGGGADGLSNTFVAGFMLLDKLGIAALENVSMIVRQAMYGGHYNLLEEHLVPNPDYWTSVLYCRLTKPGGYVMKVKCQNSSLCPQNIRAYAVQGKKNTVVLFILNLAPHKVDMILSGVSKYSSYVLTSEALQSKTMLLNGQLLFMDKKSAQLPELLPKETNKMSLPGLSYGYFVTESP